MTTEERLNRLEARLDELITMLGLQRPGNQGTAPTSSREETERIEREFLEKMNSWANGTHPWLQARQAHIEEAQARQQEAQQGHPTLERQREAVDQRLEQIERMRQQQR